MRATSKSADASLADEPASASTRRSSASPTCRPEERALALTKLSLAHPQPSVLTGPLALQDPQPGAPSCSSRRCARIGPRAQRRRASHALPEFDGGALTLGAGTKLAEARADRSDEAAEDERAVALVSVALGRPLDASATTHVRRAVAKARDGDAPLALTHLALAGAGR